jgi:ketosteroid isomerase-like protein
MKTKNLRVNQLSASAYEKYLQYLTALDNKDVAAYGKFLADDVTVQFNNDDPMSGKDNVLQGLGYYWQTFGTLEHELINIYGTDKTYVLEAKNYYTRKDGKPATVNAVAFTDLNDKGLVKSVRIYQDVSPVFK